MAVHRRSPLPFESDSASRFVQWLVMVLVFMAAISATVNAYTGSLLNHWNRSVTGTLTVQIPAAETGEPTRDVERALALLRTLPAVASAKAVPRDKVLAMLEPWLGGGSAVADLPLPALIDVELGDRSPEAAARVADALTRQVQGAVVDDHRIWLSRVTNLAEGVGIVALVLMAMIASALGLTVVIATRASLAEFAQAIELLHLVGARDDDIASQFARRALRQGVLGGILGLLLFAPTLGLVAWLAGRVASGILPDVRLPIAHWAVLAALPLVAGVLAMVSAHVTVRRALQAMP